VSLGSVQGVDAGTNTYVIETLPLPLLGAHLLVWSEATGPSAKGSWIYTSDDSAGTFGAPSTLATDLQYGLSGLVGAANDAGESLVAWYGGPTQTLAATYFTAAGTIVRNLNADPSITFPQELSVFPTTSAGTPGFAILSGQQSLPNLYVDFTTDGTSYTPTTIALPSIVADGGYYQLRSLVGTPCQIAEMLGDAGFCFAGHVTTFGTTTTAIVFAGAVVGLGGTAGVVALQTLGSYGDAGAVLDLGLVALPAGSNGQTSVSVAFVDPTQPIIGAETLYYSSFTSLALPPTVQSLSAAPHLAFTPLLLPWRGETLSVLEELSVGFASLPLPPGAQPIPPVLPGVSVSATLSGQRPPRGYIDPVTGGIVVSAVPNTNFNSVSLYELPP
jgi:hypothetical protein